MKCHSSLSQTVSLSLPVDVIVSDVGGESATVLWNSTVNTSLIEHFMVSDKYEFIHILSLKERAWVRG